MKEQATVVFADILGFSRLVMAMPDSIDNLDGFYYSSMSLLQLRESFAGGMSTDPLTRTFAAFHRTLDIRITELVNADPLQSIVFSDSAFVIFRDLGTAIYFAQAFMRNMIAFKVPVRMGIGRGSYRGLRLTTDISDEVRRHSSQFLGTGVIRAHAAESCGLKGMRILIHPDTDLIEDWPGDLCSVPGEVGQKQACPVAHELNYVWHDPDFIAGAEGPQTVDEANAQLETAVTEMMSAAPLDVRFQYEETLAAMLRMRSAYAASKAEAANPHRNTIDLSQSQL